MDKVFTFKTFQRRKQPSFFWKHQHNISSIVSIQICEQLTGPNKETTTLRTRKQHDLRVSSQPDLTISF